MRHKSSMLKVNFGGNTVGPIIAAIKKKKKSEPYTKEVWSEVVWREYFEACCTEV